MCICDNIEVLGRDVRAHGLSGSGSVVNVCNCVQ